MRTLDKVMMNLCRYNTCFSQTSSQHELSCCDEALFRRYTYNTLKLCRFGRRAVIFHRDEQGVISLIECQAIGVRRLRQGVNSLQRSGIKDRHRARALFDSDTVAVGDINALLLRIQH